MTPGVIAAEKAGIDFSLHTYEHDAKAASYGEEAADKLGLPYGQVFKTLVIALDTGQLAVAVLPVSAQLSFKQVAKALKAKKASMADPTAVQRATGYVLGGVSPLGQKKRLPALLDQSARDWPQVYISAGRRGLEIALQPDDLLRLTGAQWAALQAV